MQNLEELLKKMTEIQEEVEELISDMRASSRVKEVVGKLFKAFPETNAIVLMAAYKGDRGERFVYDFSEIEESQEEGLGDLVTINSWISNNRPSKWDPEIDALFDELAEVFPAPLESEFDWDGMELGEKKEVILYREDIEDAV
jgi:hypothetical protein